MSCFRLLKVVDSLHNRKHVKKADDCVAVRFKFLTAVTATIYVLWAVMPCNLVKAFQHFGAFSETSAHCYQTTRHHEKKAKILKRVSLHSVTCDMGLP